jgi:hypothetical protein
MLVACFQRIGNAPKIIFLCSDFKHERAFSVLFPANIVVEFMVPFLI